MIAYATRLVLDVVKMFLALCALAAFAAVNSALHWGLPSFGWHPEAAPNCYLPGTTPGTTASTAAVEPALSLASLIPDLPSTIGKVQGAWLHQLQVHPPSDKQVAALFIDTGDAVSRWARTVRSTANGQKVPADVAAYQHQHQLEQAQHAQQVAARNAAACNPCNPGMNTPDDKSTEHVAYRPRGEVLTRAAAAAAGWTGTDLDTAVAIAGAESGYDPLAANPSSSARGLWQILLSAHQDLPGINDWSDPYTNARLAHQVWLDAGESWAPWTTYTSGAYTRYLPAKDARATSVKDSMTCASYQTSGQPTPPSAWGGYQNGRIPVTALAHPSTAPSAMLRPDAAAAWDAMSAAFRADTGRYLTITSSYRSYRMQVITKRDKGNLAATPGKSNHGWGLAVDAGLGGFNTSTYKWVQVNGAQYGWVSPSWAQKDGSKPEYWHLEYYGPDAGTTTA